MTDPTPEPDLQRIVEAMIPTSPRLPLWFLDRESGDLRWGQPLVVGGPDLDLEACEAALLFCLEGEECLRRSLGAGRPSWRDDWRFS